MLRPEPEGIVHLADTGKPLANVKNKNKKRAQVAWKVQLTSFLVTQDAGSYVVASVIAQCVTLCAAHCPCSSCRHEGL